LKKRHLMLPLALAALALGLAACGGSDESDEDKIIDVIETSVTSTDPADCEKFATQAFLEQTELSEGKEALESCEESAKDTEDDPDSVDVTEVEVDGSSATADAAFVGGSFDGQALTVALVEDDGDWKLDEITGFSKLDKEQLATSFEEAFEGEEDFDPQVASCFGEVLRELDDPEVEEVVIGGSVDPVVEIVEGCTEGQE
jgi:hypothetical protein